MDEFSEWNREMRNKKNAPERRSRGVFKWTITRRRRVIFERSVRKTLRGRQRTPRWRLDDRSVANVAALLPDDEERTATKNTKRHEREPSFFVRFCAFCGNGILTKPPKLPMLRGR